MGAGVQMLTPNIMAVQTKTSDVKVKTDNSSSDFSKVMDNASKTSFKKSKSDDIVSDDKIGIKMEKNKDIIKKLEDSDESELISSDVSGLVLINQSVEDIKEVIAQELGISIEDVNNIINQMDISDYELFDANKLIAIVVENGELSGPEEVLVNDEMSKAFKEIMVEVENIKNELINKGFDLSSESLKGFEEINLKETQIIESKEELIETNQVTFEEEIASNEVILDDNLTKEKTSIENSVEKTVETDSDSLNTTTKEIVTQTSGKEGESDMLNKGNEKETQNMFLENGISSKNNILNEIENVLTQKVGTTQSESIVNQLVEQIKLNVGQDFTSMEMQLYPEHLGKVGVQIIAKDGIITAQLTAESETVKKVLETQLNILKENITNQGIKIEEVEVTIASHSFEQNNMSNGNEQDKSRKNTKNRKIDEALINEILANEEIEDEQMKIALGNNVNYSA